MIQANVLACRPSPAMGIVASGTVRLAQPPSGPVCPPQHSLCSKKPYSNHESVAATRLRVIFEGAVVSVVAHRGTSEHGGAPRLASSIRGLSPETRGAPLPTLLRPQTDMHDSVAAAMYSQRQAPLQCRQCPRLRRISKQGILHTRMRSEASVFSQELSLRPPSGRGVSDRREAGPSSMQSTAVPPGRTCAE